MKILTLTQITPEFRQEWLSLWERSCHSHFFNHPDWTESASHHPIIYAVYDNNKLVAVLPLEKSQKYLTSIFQCPGGNCLDHSTLLLLNPDPEVFSLLVKTVNNKGHLYISEVCESLVNQMPHKLPGQILFPRPYSTSPYLNLQPDPFKYLSHKHHKQITSLLTQYQSHLKFELIYPCSQSDLKQVIDLEKSSNKCHKSTEQLTSPFVCGLLEKLASKSQVCIAKLYFDDQLIAADIGYIYSQVFHNFYTVYNQNYAYCIPGRILKYLTIKYLHEKNYIKYDFSRGVSRYKHDFTQQDSRHYDYFFSTDPLVRARWEVCSTLVSWLEKHHTLYQKARLIKHLHLNK